MAKKPIYLLVGLLLLASLASARIVPTPTATSVNQNRSTVSTYNILLSNTQNYSETITIHTPSFVTTPSATLIFSSYENKTVSYTINTSTLAPAVYTLYLQFTGATDGATDFVLYLNVLQPSSGGGGGGSQEWYQILDDEWVGVNTSIEYGDYMLQITELTSSRASFKYYENGEYQKKVNVYEGENITIQDETTRVQVYDARKNDEVRMSLYSDDEYDVTVSEGGGAYQYRIVSSQQFAQGTTLSFGNFYFTIDYIAVNGIYLNTGTQYRIQCFTGQDCFPTQDIKVRIDDLKAQSTVRLTIDSKQLCIVQTTQGQIGAFCNNNKQCEYWLGEGSSCTDCGGTTTTPYTSAQSMFIQLMGGTIAPGNKLYVYVTDQNSVSIQTGLITVDAGKEPKLFDINNGVAKVQLPLDLKCPVGMTATSSGYKATTQIFSTCSDEGSLNWTEIPPEDGGTVQPGEKEMSVTHSGSARIKDSTTITVLYNNVGVSLAKIKITPPDNNIQTTSTNAEGKITLSLEKLGVWRILAQKTGYKDTEYSFEVTRKPLTMEFSPSSPKLHDTVDAIVRSEGTPTPNIDVRVEGPSLSTTQSTNTAGRVSFKVDKMGDYRAKADSPEYAILEQTINVPGKTMKITLNPQTPTCGQQVSITIQDQDSGYTLTDTVDIKVDGSITGRTWNAAEGSHVITASSPDYVEARAELSVECQGILIQPPISVKAGGVITAQFNKNTAWQIVCTDRKTGNNITLSETSQTISRKIDNPADCVLKYGKDYSLATPFQVQSAGLLSFEMDESWWYIIGVLLILVMIVYAKKKGILGGSSDYHMEAGKYPPKGANLIPREGE